jgi:5S rRNA maturation endonuclease (ribonuclease M5)
MGGRILRLDTEAMLAILKELEDCLLVVEGKRDAKSLKTLGLKNIVIINRRPLVSVADEVAGLADHKAPQGKTIGQEGLYRGNHSDIIILTDFDREGRRMDARLSSLLRARCVHPNQRLRLRVMKFGFNKIEDITLESVKRLGSRSRRGDDNVKASAYIDKVRHKGVNKGKRYSGEA